SCRRRVPVCKQGSVLWKNSACDVGFEVHDQPHMAAFRARVELYKPFLVVIRENYRHLAASPEEISTAGLSGAKYAKCRLKLGRVGLRRGVIAIVVLRFIILALLLAALARCSGPVPPVSQAA